MDSSSFVASASSVTPNTADNKSVGGADDILEQLAATEEREKTLRANIEKRVAGGGTGDLFAQLGATEARERIQRRLGAGIGGTTGSGGGTDGNNNDSGPGNSDIPGRLAASEEREKILRAEVRQLRMERDLQTRAAARAQAALSNGRSLEAEELSRIRSENERLRGDLARLRSDGIALQRALESARRRAITADSDRNTCEKNRVALERVCINLRARVATSEKEALRANQVDEAIAARDRARSALGDAKAAAEENLVRATKAEMERDESMTRMQKMEGKIERLENARSKTSRELSRAKKLLHDNEEKIKRLSNALVTSSSSTSTHTDSRRSRRSRSNTHSSKSSKSSRARSNTSFLLEDDSRRDGHRNGHRNGSHSRDRDGDIGNISHGDDVGGSESSSIRADDITEASPLLRAVERAHRQLQAAFEESDQHADDVHSRLARS